MGGTPEKWAEHSSLTANDTIRPVSFPDMEVPLKAFPVTLRH